MFSRKTNKELMNKYSDLIESYANNIYVSDMIVDVNVVKAYLDGLKDKIKSRYPSSNAKLIFLSLKLADLNEQYQNELRKLESEYLEGLV